MDVGSRRTLSAIITLSCDGKCRHCYIDSQPRGETPELSLETWKNVLDDFRSMGGEEFCTHGGEPLLYDGVGELIQHAHSIGLRTGIITNAIHLDDEFSQVLSACSTYALVSLDKLTADFDLPNPRDYILGDVFHPGSLDEKAYIRYRRMLDGAFLRGLRELRAGKAINWYEVVRSEVLDSS